MSELIVVKHSYTSTCWSEGGRFQFPCEKIVALTPTNEATIAEFGHVFTGDEHEEVLNMPRMTIDGIVEFYKQTRAKPAEERPDYSCHTFTYFVLGAITKIGFPDEFWINDRKRQWRTNHLASGEAYLTKNRAGAYNHSMLGIDRPAFNVCVAGNNNPLDIMSNHDVMRMYNSRALFRYWPHSMTLQD